MSAFPTPPLDSAERLAAMRRQRASRIWIARFVNPPVLGLRPRAPEPIVFSHDWLQSELAILDGLAGLSLSKRGGADVYLSESNYYILSANSAHFWPSPGPVYRIGCCGEGSETVNLHPVDWANDNVVYFRADVNPPVPSEG